jgi:hypothetical protein
MSAPEIATRRGDGIGLTSRLKMKERFFFYGVHILSDDLVVHEAIENAILVLPYGTQTQFAVRDMASV